MIRFVVALVVLVGAHFGPAHAQTLTMVQELDFGRLLTTDDAPGFVVMPANGPAGVTTSTNIVRISNGQPGEMLVEGLSPGQEVDVSSLGPIVLSRTVFTNATTLRVTNLTTYPSPVFADGLGRAQFQVGARLETTGRTPAGMDDEFTGDLVVTVTPLP